MKCKLKKEQIEMIVNRLALRLLDYCYNNDLKYTVTAVSGGLDSAVTIGISQIASRLAKKKNFKLSSLGLILPCYSSNKSRKLAHEVIQKFKVKEIEMNLSSIYNYLDGELLEELEKKVRTVTNLQISNNSHMGKITRGNVKARLRMITNYHVARITNGVVLSTDNLSEYFMGFWTLHGDVGDFPTIQYVLKGFELKDIANYLKVPEEIVSAKPDDGLGVTDGGDEAQLGATYPIVDRIIIGLIQKGFDPDGPISQLKNLPHIENVDPQTVHNVAKRSLQNSFKRTENLSDLCDNREKVGLPSLYDIAL